MLMQTLCKKGMKMKKAVNTLNLYLPFLTFHDGSYPRLLSLTPPQIFAFLLRTCPVQSFCTDKYFLRFSSILSLIVSLRL